MLVPRQMKIYQPLGCPGYRTQSIAVHTQCTDTLHGTVWLKQKMQLTKTPGIEQQATCVRVLSRSMVLLLRCALTPGSGPGLDAWVAFMTSRVASRDLATCCDLWPVIGDAWVSLLTHVY